MCDNPVTPGSAYDDTMTRAGAHNVGREAPDTHGGRMPKEVAISLMPEVIAHSSNAYGMKAIGAILADPDWREVRRSATTASSRST